MAHKKSRKHVFGRGEGGGVNLGLIITPMLDMAFQLLAFFVMTYHPPAFVGFVEGSLLPPSKDVAKKIEEKKKQDDQKKTDLPAVGKKIKKDDKEEDKTKDKAKNDP